MSTSDRHGALHDAAGRYAEKPKTAPGAGAQLPPALTEASVISNVNPTGGVYVDYDPGSRAGARLTENMRPLNETIGGDFHDVITIYRGVPPDGTGIVPGDFVTTNRQLAQDYAGNGRVVELRVPMGHVVDDATEPGGEEYLYLPGAFGGSAATDSHETVQGPPVGVPTWVDESSATRDPARAAQAEVFLAAMTALADDAVDRQREAGSLMASPGWYTNDGFTCDGGAMAAHLAARRLGIPSQLCVGLYWHSDVELRADLMGEIPPDEDADQDEWDQWRADLDHIARECMDEHHHWVVLWPGTEHATIFDPNGEVRDEPHLRDAAGTGKQYEEILHGEWRRPEYDPDVDDIEAEAEAVYPGIGADVDAALTRSGEKLRALHEEGIADERDYGWCISCGKPCHLPAPAACRARAAHDG